MPRSYIVLTDITISSIVGGHMFLVTPTDGAIVHLHTFAKLDGVTAICCVHVTRITNHTCQKHLTFKTCLHLKGT